MKISNPRFLCTENPQPQIELLSVIVLEYICCKILAWLFSVFGVLHDSCNFTFAMRWVLCKMKRPQGWAFRFSKHLPGCPRDTHWVSWGEKKQHKVFMLGKALSQWALPESSISLQQQLLTNTSLCLSHATICEQHRFVCLS